MRRIAAIGDIHGCIYELTDLLKRLEWLSLDEIWSLGDICDRGPDSGACYALLREKKIKSILGNHDESILLHYEKFIENGKIPGNADKARSVSQLTPDDVAWIKSMPKIHVFDDIGLVLVHGGLWPRIPLYAQPHNVVRAQLIHPDNFGECRWWGPDATLHKCKKTEAESLKDGYHRWYRLYDFGYDVAYGHSVWNQPYIHRNPGAGRTVGIDTGSPFGGLLTAGIFGEGDPYFLSVKARQIWAGETTRTLFEV